MIKRLLVIAASFVLLEGGLTACNGASTGDSSSVASTVTVGDTVWVSKADPNRENYEMIGAVDPEDSSHMLACTTSFSQKTNARDSVVYASFDGGKSWQQTLDDHTTVFTGDPACSFGFNGVAYFASLPIYGGPHLTSGEQLYQSNDYGKTWRVIMKRAFQDREYITVDHTNSRFRGNAYLYADGIGRRLSNGSVDGWDIFRIQNGLVGPPVLSPDSKKFVSMNAYNGAITLNGTLVVPFEGLPITPLTSAAHAARGFQFGIIRSTDGGKSLLPAHLLGPGCSIYTKPARLTTALGSPVAVDMTNGPFRGRVYTAYAIDNVDHCSIAEVYSDDNGATWSAPVMLHEDSPSSAYPQAPVQAMPALAVNKNGVVGLSWYDTRGDRTGNGYKLRFAASYDGGQSFTPSIDVSHYEQNIISDSNPFFFGADAASGGASRKKPGSEPIDSNAGPDWMTISRPGDTRSTIADSQGRFFPFWYDTHTGISQLYTAPVMVAGAASKNGDPSLAHYTDITKQVTLDYTSTDFDATSGTMHLAAQLVNRSNATIRGDVKMRLLWAESTAGTPVARNAENDLSGNDAIWDFSTAVPAGGLKPYTESQPITLTFRINDLDKSKMDFPLINFQTRVYAGKS